MTNKLLILIALIPLLMLTPSLSYAVVTPEQDKCIHSVIVDTTNKIVAGMTLHKGLNVLRTVNNATAAIEACIE
jgi:hypothetical protein